MAMNRGRHEAFSDGVLAIIITIMVLELKVPQASDIKALKPLIPHLLSYVLSLITIGIDWNNHHHMLQAARHGSGRVLWADLILLSGCRCSRLPPAGWVRITSRH
jgi:uncharacterized membrane protein